MFYSLRPDKRPREQCGSGCTIFVLFDHAGKTRNGVGQGRGQGEFAFRFSVFGDCLLLASLCNPVCAMKSSNSMLRSPRDTLGCLLPVFRRIAFLCMVRPVTRGVVWSLHPDGLKRLPVPTLSRKENTRLSVRRSREAKH